MAEVLDELPDDAEAPQDLCDREDEVGCGRTFRKLPGEPEADHLRDEHGDGLAEEHGLRLDPADAPAKDSQAVDHGRVRVCADQRVREGKRAPALLSRLDDAGQVLEVHLVDDPRWAARR